MLTLTLNGQFIAVIVPYKETPDPSVFVVVFSATTADAPFKPDLNASHLLSSPVSAFQPDNSRTWAGRLIQLQNLPQNHMSDLSEARELVRTGDYDTMNLLYDDIRIPSVS